MFIDIGASSREEAEKMVSPGDVAVYAPDFFDLGVDMIAGPAMDNRVGCAVLIGMLKALKEKNNEIVAVFTTQEEVGLRGATAAAYDVNPDLGIALDVTISGDTPNGAKVAMKAGEGPCVKIMDRSLVCSPKVVSLMEEAAQWRGREVPARGPDGGRHRRGRDSADPGRRPCGAFCPSPAATSIRRARLCPLRTSRAAWPFLRSYATRNCKK